MGRRFEGNVGESEGCAVGAKATFAGLEEEEQGDPAERCHRAQGRSSRSQVADRQRVVPELEGQQPLRELLGIDEPDGAGRPLLEVVRNVDLQAIITQALETDEPVAGLPAKIRQLTAVTLKVADEFEAEPTSIESLLADLGRRQHGTMQQIQRLLAASEAGRMGAP